MSRALLARRWIPVAALAAAAALAAGIVSALAAPGAPTITGGPTGPTADATPTFTWAGEPGGTFDWEIPGTGEGESATTATSATVGASLGDGPYTFRVRQRDDADDPGPYAERSFTVDTTGPAAPSVSGPPSPTNDNTPTFSWTPSEPGGTFQWELLDGGVLERDGATAATSVEISPAVPDGSYGFRVRHVDGVGNVGPFSPQVNVTIDTAAPGTPTVGAVTSPTNDTTPTFSWAKTEGGGTSFWELRAGSTAAGALVQSGNTGGTGATMAALADGTYNFRVRHQDAAGNSSAFSDPTVIVVDTTGPAAPSVSGPPSPTADTTPTFSWTPTEPGGTFQWQLRSGTTVVRDGTTGATGVEVTPAVSDGTYNFRVRHVDGLGNAGPFSSPVNVTIDTTGPAPPSVSGPASPTNDNTPAFSWTPTEPGGAFQWQLRVGSTVARADTTASLGVEISNPAVPDGAYNFRVRHVDGLGNVGDFSSPVNLTIDTVAPSISGATVPASPNGQNGWFTSNVQVNFTCDALGGSPIAQCGPNVTLGSNTPGQTVQGTATDAAGNTSDPITVGPIKIDKDAPPRPEPVFPTQDVVTNDVRQELSWSAVSDVGPSGVASYAVVVERASGGQVVHTGTTTSPSYTPDADLPSGELRWHVVPRDVAGNVLGPPPVGDRVTFTVDPSATPPPLIAAGPSGPTNVTQPAFSWVGHPDAVEYEWRVLRGGNEVAAGELDAPFSQVQIPQPLAEDGGYSFQVRQRLSVGVHGASAVRAFTLDTVAPAAPVIVTRPPASSINAEPVFGWTGEPGGIFQWQALAFDGSPVQGGEGSARSVSLGPLPAGAPYTFRVRQIDAAGNVGPFTAPAAFSIEAPPPPAPPGGATPPPPATGDQTPNSTHAAPSAKVRPATANVGRLNPRVGAVLRTLRPTLRWKPGPRGTRLYNVQIFVMEGTTLRKVLSAFPRTNRYRVPAKRLKYGERYVWRPWPYLRTGSFAKRAIGTSFFDVERPRVSPQRARLLAPSGAATKARRAFTVRWRAKAGTPVYRVTMLRGKTTTFSKVVRGTRVRVPARAVRVAGSHRIVVRGGRAPTAPVWAARPIPVTR